VNLAKQIKGTGATPEEKGMVGDSLANRGAVGAITPEMMKRANQEFGAGKINEKTFRAIKARYERQPVARE
jgi:hypothetical protein